jgi:hypothetical protein
LINILLVDVVKLRLKAFINLAQRQAKQRLGLTCIVAKGAG